LSKRTKYVPKHRQAPERPLVTAPKKAVRNTLVMSSVAVAATGVAVSGGVLHSTSSDTGVATAAADDLGTVTGSAARASLAGQVPKFDRAPVVSRSSDRRDAADPAKEASLSVKSGPATTDRVRVRARVEAPQPEAPQGDPRSIARAMLPQFGFSSDQFSCLDSLWTKESGWNPSADNPTSSAYGIPQALPGSKMSSAGADWATNPATQIKWGLGYIRDSYGSPCAAWGHSQAYNWY
jgi:hypothetical protein